MPLLECVPNVSEGRRASVLARLERALHRPDVALLDVSSDADHNRTVYTLAGEPDALFAALHGLYEVALAEIDLREHEGVHPRIGAVDVVPFVPLEGASMADAVDAAAIFGAEVAERHGVPVFLYEEAARSAARRRLADLRRGGPAGLAQRMTDAGWCPDFGACRLHESAGASAVGARFFLIAFNVLLATADVALARAIARSVRESSGGLPAVRAMGVFLSRRGVAQVSMNLVDYRRTSILAALEAVSREATARGTKVQEAEIVGLVPEAAFQASPRSLLMLPSNDPDRTLERRLRISNSAPPPRGG